MDTPNVGSSVDSSAKTGDSEGLQSASPGDEHEFVDRSGEGNDSDEDFVRDPDFEEGLVLSPVPATPTEPSPVVSPTREANLPRRRGPDIQNLFVVSGHHPSRCLEVRCYLYYSIHYLKLFKLESNHFLVFAIQCWVKSQLPASLFEGAKNEERWRST